MTEPAPGAEKRGLLQRIATHPRLPAFLRSAFTRLANSSLATRLAHGAFWSLAGAALSRGGALAASVVTARVLGKDGYGQFGLLASTLLTFQTFAGLGLGITATKFVAELRTKDPERAGRILALSGIVSAGTGLVAAALLWFFAPWVAAHTIDAPQLAGPLRIAALGLVFSTLGGAQSGALAGFEAFRVMTWLNLWSGLLGVVAAVVGVWFWGLEGAVWATVVSAFIQWSLTHVAVRALARRHDIRIGVRGWWREQRVLWTFSLPAMAQGVMVAPVTWAAGAILVYQHQGFAEMGALSAANQWYGAVMFLPSALGNAVFPVLAERVGQRDMLGVRNVLRAGMALNAAVVLPIILAGAVASPWIMGMYGKGFGAAWPTLVVVLITSGVVAVTNPVGGVLGASGRLWLSFLMNSGWAAVFLISTLLLVDRGSLGVATARLIGYVVHSVWTVWFAMSFIRDRQAERARAPEAKEDEG